MKKFTLVFRKLFKKKRSNGIFYNMFNTHYENMSMYFMKWMLKCIREVICIVNVKISIQNPHICQVKTNHFCKLDKCN